MFMENAAPLTLVDHSSLYRNNPFRRVCVLATAAELVLHLIKNNRMFAKEKKIVSYHQFRFVISASPGNKNIISNFCGSKRGERTMVPASHSGEKTASKNLPSR